MIAATMNLLAGLYLTGMRSSIGRLNLFTSADWLGAFVPLIADLGSTVDTNGRYTTINQGAASGAFQSTDWSLLNGLSAASNSALNNNVVDTGMVGKYIDTGILETVPVLNNGAMHMAIWNATEGQNTKVTDISAYYTDLQSYYNSNQQLFNCYGQMTSAGQGSTAGFYYGTNPRTPVGMYLGNRTSNNFCALYLNGSLIPSGTNGNVPNPNYNTAPSTSTSHPVNFRVFCQSNGSSASSNHGFSDRTVRMYSIGTGLSDPLSYYNLLNTFFSTIAANQ